MYVTGIAVPSRDELDVRRWSGTTDNVRVYRAAAGQRSACSGWRRIHRIAFCPQKPPLSPRDRQQHGVQQPFLLAAARVEGGQSIGEPQEIGAAILLRGDQHP